MYSLLLLSYGPVANQALVTFFVRATTGILSCPIDAAQQLFDNAKG